MGPARAQAAAVGLGARSGRGACSWLGFCGGLDAASVPGEVIVAEERLAATDEGHEPELVECAEVDALVDDGRAAPACACAAGRSCASSRLALGERRAQLHAGGALAVDMESVWLAAARPAARSASCASCSTVPSHELMRPQAAAGALRAARALRRVGARVHEWQAEG